MNTRFYAGPISSGMGRRWDDWLEPPMPAPPSTWRMPATLQRPMPSPWPRSLFDARRVPTIRQR